MATKGSIEARRELLNQPGVEEGKNFTYGMMGKKRFEAKKEEVEKARREEDVLKV